MNRTLKVGIIGLGHLHPFTYMPHFKRCKLTDVVAAVDRNAALREDFTNQFNLPTYTDYTEMVEKEKPELVYIFLPHCECADAAVYCAERGIHVVVEKPVADAIGSGLDVMDASGVMVVNIGADTTEISIMSLGGIVLSKLVSTGGNKFDELIINNVKKKYNLIIGHKTAETIKKKLSYAIDPEHETIKVYGRDVMSGLPTEAEIDSEFVYETINESLHSIVDAVRIILEKTPPEISSDIIDSGIYITGATLYGLRVETCYVITENGAEPLCPWFEEELFNYVK